MTCTGDDDTPEGSYRPSPGHGTTTDFCLNSNSDTQTIYVVDSTKSIQLVLYRMTIVDCAAYDAGTEYGIGQRHGQL